MSIWLWVLIGIIGLPLCALFIIFIIFIILGILIANADRADLKTRSRYACLHCKKKITRKFFLDKFKTSKNIQKDKTGMCLYIEYIRVQCPHCRKFFDVAREEGFENGGLWLDKRHGEISITSIDTEIGRSKSFAPTKKGQKEMSKWQKENEKVKKKLKQGIKRIEVSDGVIISK